MHKWTCLGKNKRLGNEACIGIPALNTPRLAKAPNHFARSRTGPGSDVATMTRVRCSFQYGLPEADCHDRLGWELLFCFPHEVVRTCLLFVMPTPARSSMLILWMRPFLFLLSGHIPLHPLWQVQCILCAYNSAKYRIWRLWPQYWHPSKSRHAWKKMAWNKRTDTTRRKDKGETNLLFLAHHIPSPTLHVQASIWRRWGPSNGTKVRWSQLR